MKLSSGVILLLWAVVATASEPELLPAEQAFRVSAQFKDAKTVALTYQIADGYYLYRKRFHFDAIEGAKLGKAVLPTGKMKQDATFGRVETYRKSVRVLLPITSVAKATHLNPGDKIRLKLTSQGCADAGVCYPPVKQDVVLTVGSNEAVEPGGDGGRKPSSIADLVKRAP